VIIRVRPHPDLIQFQNALDQTQGSGTLAAGEWRTLVARRLEQIDAAALASDVGPFLEHASDASLLSAEHIAAALKA
jgi:hypothetical protein